MVARRCWWHSGLVGGTQAHKIHAGPAAVSNSRPQQPMGQLPSDIDPLLSSEEFRKLQLEVERLGEKGCGRTGLCHVSVCHGQCWEWEPSHRLSTRESLSRHGGCEEKSHLAHPTPSSPNPVSLIHSIPSPSSPLSRLPQSHPSISPSSSPSICDQAVTPSTRSSARSGRRMWCNGWGARRTRRRNAQPRSARWAPRDVMGEGMGGHVLSLRQ